MAKNKDFIILAFIFIAAVVLRVLCLDKTGGLWYDEIVSYKEAVQPNIFAVIAYTLKTDVHLPVYPVLLHMWSKIFSLSDISLRMFSALSGVLTVIVAYFAGLNLKDKNTGLWCAGIFAINSFLIYYSQEVRLYSLLMLFILLLSLFAIKIVKHDNNEIGRKAWLDYVLFVIFAWLAVHTYTIAFIYVIAAIAVVYALKIKNDNNLKPLNYSIVGLMVMSLPSIIYLTINHNFYTNQINGYYCDWSSLFVVLQSWFSPVLIGLLNNPVHYIGSMLTELSLKSVVFILVPVGFSLGIIGYALKKDRNLLFLLVPSLVFLIAEIAAFVLTNFKILPRYTAAALPNILLVLGCGFAVLPKKHFFKIITAGLFVLINFSYLVFADTAAFKLPRDGFRPVAELVNSQDLHKDDFVVVWNRKEVLDKYVQTNELNVLSLLKDFAYRSEVILDNEEKLNKISLEERKTLLRPYFADMHPSTNNVSLMAFLLQGMKKGQKFIIISNPYFDSYSPQKFSEIVNDDHAYSLISYNDLLTVKSLITIKQMCAVNLNFVGKFEKDNNVIFVFER